MSASYDEAVARIQGLCKEFSAFKDDKINEDTTRLRLVDCLLFECLDWDKLSQAETEEQTDVGKTDYTLSIDGNPMVIVEAKKTGISFTLPADRQGHKMSHSIASVMTWDKGIGSALSQCAGYALDKGAPFAIVTNGWQLIAFCTQLGPGKSWRTGNALVFDSLERIRAQFFVYWNNLSVHGISSYILQKTLTERTLSAPCTKRSSLIPNYNRAKNRNNLQADLQVLGELVFSGSIFEDRELFHHHCYCSSGAISQFSRASRNYLEDRYPEIFRDTAGTPALEPATTKRGPADALVNMTNIKKPIIVLGEVGVGKTTFLEHLFLVDWKDRKDSLIVLRVDLGDKPSRPEDVPGTAAAEIERSLLEDYGIDIREDGFVRGVYHGQLKRFTKSPEGALAQIDPVAYKRAEIDYLKGLQQSFDEHLRHVFNHLVRGRKKILVIIFDNVDQREPELQKAAFIQAQVAASTWDIFVMLTLRPETFVLSKASGALSGYHPRAFTISPPRFDQLIDRRIETAISMLEGRLPLPALGSNVKLNVMSVVDYLSILRQSFASDPDIVSFCEDISGGNMRLALDYIVSFMSCGHVDAQKILDKWRAKKGSADRYKIPYHEFVRGVMFGEREYYAGKDAWVVNVFECKSNDRRESLLLLFILNMLQSDMARGNADGYMRVSECEGKILSLGFLPEQASWAMARCVDERLAENNLKVPGLTSDSTHVRITQTGSYYFRKLVRTFVYIDAVCVDTPICDKFSFDRIGDAHRVPERIARAQAFMAYLDGIYIGSGALSAELDWTSIASAVREDMARAEQSYRRTMERASAKPGNS